MATVSDFRAAVLHLHKQFLSDPDGFCHANPDVQAIYGIRSDRPRADHSAAMLRGIATRQARWLAEAGTIVEWSVEEVVGGEAVLVVGRITEARG